MISSNSQHKVHSLVPRRKVKSGSAAASASDGRSSSSRATTTSIHEKAPLTATSYLGMSVATTSISREHTDRSSSQVHHELTPDKSSTPSQEEDDSSSSSEEESEPSSERSLLISQIDTSKLSPDIDPDTLSNYELLRLRNIQRNEAKLASLGLIGLTTKDKKSKNATNARPKTKPGNNNLMLWRTRYQELVAFHAAHGHVTVPSSHVPLYTWTKRQKAQYKMYKEGKACSLDDERAGMLEKLDVEEFWLGRVRTVVHKSKQSANAKKNDKRKKAKNHLDSADEEELGSLDSYSDYEEELDFPPQKNGSSMRRELESLASPKWMDGYSDEDEAQSFRGVSSSARTVGEFPRYKLSSNIRRGHSFVDDYSDDEDYYATKQGDSAKRGDPQMKSMLHSSSRHFVPDYYESDDYSTYKTRSESPRRGINFKAHHPTKTPKSRISREKYSDDDSSIEFDATSGRIKSSTKRRSPKNGGGRTSIGDYADDDVRAVDYDDVRTGGGWSTRRSENNRGSQRVMEGNSDDDEYSFEHDDANIRTRSSVRSRLPQKHRVRMSIDNYSQDDCGSMDYVTTQHRGGMSNNRKPTKKHRGRKSKAYSDDDEKNSVDYTTAKRFDRCSKKSRSTQKRKGQRLVEAYSDDGDPQSVEHSSRMMRRGSAKNGGKFSRHDFTRSLLNTEMQRKKSSNANHCSPQILEKSSPKLTESKTTSVRMVNRHTKTSLEQIDERSINAPAITHKPSKRKRFVSAGLEPSSSKRRRSDFSDDFDSGTHRSDVASSSSASSSSASTKSSSLDQPIKPIKEVVITQTLSRHARHKSLQLERYQLLAEYTQLSRRKCLLIQKIPRVLCELNSLHLQLIEHNSKLVKNALEGPMQLIMKKQNAGLTEGSTLTNTFEDFSANLATVAASANGYHAMLNHGI